MADETLLMIGTRKGLWIGRSDAARQEWTIEGPHFPMMEIYSCLVDTRGDRPRLLVGASLSWTGPQVFSSDDLGQTWQEHPIGFPDGLDASVERVWQLVPGARARGGVRRHRAGRGLQVHRPGCDLRPRARPVGPPPPHRVGRGLRRAGVPHAAAAPRRRSAR